MSEKQTKTENEIDAEITFSGDVKRSGKTRAVLTPVGMKPARINAFTTHYNASKTHVSKARKEIIEMGVIAYEIKCAIVETQARGRYWERAIKDGSLPKINDNYRKGLIDLGTWEIEGLPEICKYSGTLASFIASKWALKSSPDTIARAIKTHVRELSDPGSKNKTKKSKKKDANEDPRPPDDNSAVLKPLSKCENDEIHEALGAIQAELISRYKKHAYNLDALNDMLRVIDNLREFTIDEANFQRAENKQREIDKRDKKRA